MTDETLNEELEQVRRAAGGGEEPRQRFQEAAGDLHSLGAFTASVMPADLSTDGQTQGRLHY